MMSGRHSSSAKGPRMASDQEVPHSSMLRLTLTPVPPGQGICAVTSQLWLQSRLVLTTPPDRAVPHFCRATAVHSTCLLVGEGNLLEGFQLLVSRLLCEAECPDCHQDGPREASCGPVCCTRATYLSTIRRPRIGVWEMRSHFLYVQWGTVPPARAGGGAGRTF